MNWPKAPAGSLGKINGERRNAVHSLLDLKTVLLKRTRSGERERVGVSREGFT